MATRHPFIQTLDRHFLTWAIAALLAALYGPLLIHWYDGWLNKSISTEHEYFSHGLLGLPLAAYLVWGHRQRWSQLPDTSHWLGLGLLMGGVALYLSGPTDFVNLSLPVLLVGLCLWLKGIPGLKLQAFPLVLVIFATPNQIPYLLAPYTLPLQSFIAHVAGFLLLQLGVNVRVEQIYLFVNDRIVEVAPYCAGLKMLFTSLYVGLILIYWTGNWVSRHRTVLFFSGIVAISVGSNIIRNTLLTYFHGTGREGAFEWLHDGWGGDLYSAAMLALLVVLLRVLEQYSTPPPGLKQDRGSTAG